MLCEAMSRINYRVSRATVMPNGLRIPLRKFQPVKPICLPLSLRYPGRVERSYQRRQLVTLQTFLLPPLVFGGLVVALWTWKCMMMVIFQNKIIYMPGIPPNARREKIEDYRNQCGGINWEEKKTKAGDGTSISLCVASVESGPDPVQTVYVLYFQGNASSLPPRLPFLSPVLQILKGKSERPAMRYKMVCCSYRGFWTSSGRPSEHGIMKDAQAAVEWIKEDVKSNSTVAKPQASRLVIWGQSIGAGVATDLARELSSNTLDMKCDLMILETPFTSIKDMLATLYPQKWLPYRYLSPFLRNHLDSVAALEGFSNNARWITSVLILDAGKDELVPKSHGDEIEALARELGFDTHRHTVAGALHTEVMSRQEGRFAVVNAINRLVSVVK